MTTPPGDLPEKPCHRTREHVPHVDYDNYIPQHWCPGVGNLFPPDRLTSPADPFEGLDDTGYDGTLPGVS